MELLTEERTSPVFAFNFTESLAPSEFSGEWDADKDTWRHDMKFAPKAYGTSPYSTQSCITTYTGANSPGTQDCDTLTDYGDECYDC